MTEESDALIGVSRCPKWIQRIQKLNWLDYSVKLCLGSAVVVGLCSIVILFTEAKTYAEKISHFSTILGSIGTVGAYGFGKRVFEQILKQLSIQTSTPVKERVEQLELGLLQSQPLKPNEEIPSVDLFEGSIPTTTINVCRGKKVIILVLLGTRDEITKNLKDFVERVDSFKALGVEDNICVIMSAADSEQQATVFHGSGDVRILFDRNSELSKTSCAILLQDGIIELLEFERENPEESLLECLYKRMKEKEEQQNMPC